MTAIYDHLYIHRYVQQPTLLAIYAYSKWCLFHAASLQNYIFVQNTWFFIHVALTILNRTISIKNHYQMHV